MEPWLVLLELWSSHILNQSINVVPLPHCWLCFLFTQLGKGLAPSRNSGLSLPSSRRLRCDRSGFSPLPLFTMCHYIHS